MSSPKVDRDSEAHLVAAVCIIEGVLGLLSVDQRLARLGHSPSNSVRVAETVGCAIFALAVTRLLRASTAIRAATPDRARRLILSALWLIALTLSVLLPISYAAGL